MSPTPSTPSSNSSDASTALATRPGPLLPARLGAGLPFTVPPADAEAFARLPWGERVAVQRLLSIFRAVAGAAKREAEFRLQAAAHRQHGRGYSRQSLKRGFYTYCEAHGDWRVLVNKARVPEGLPAAFLEFVEGWFLRNKRRHRQQWVKLKRYWEQGCDDQGKPFRVPGYGTWQEWWRAEHPDRPLPAQCPGLPRGWSYSRLLQLLRRRLTRAQIVMAREGTAAARAHTPHVLGTRAGLRFLEVVTFDDVRCDFRVLDPVSGRPVDLWLLVAMDRATAVVLGYQMRLARERAEGSQERINILDMKQLVAWVLWQWKLPPYRVTWKLERGTATLGPDLVASVQQLFGERVAVSFNEMVSGVSAAGYREKGKGNSRAKASHESHNNLLHNMAGDLPGQMGRRYDVRPADLDAREREAVETMALAGRLSEERWRQVKFPLLSAAEARRELHRIFHAMNSRTLHELEGFEAVDEWRQGPEGLWRPLAECPAPAPEGFEARRRMESPYERMARLTAGLEFTSPARSSLVHFLAHTQRLVRVNDRGEIEAKLDGKVMTFAPPTGDEAATAGQEFLAYYHPEDPALLHLTHLPPHSGYAGTWALRQRIRHGDEEALSAALSYTRGAEKAQREHLHRVCIGEAAELQAMRTHNARLVAEQAADDAALDVEDVHAVAPVGVAGSAEDAGPVAVALSAGRVATAASRARRQAAAQEDCARAEAAEDAATKRAERREAALMAASKMTEHYQEKNYGQEA